MTYEVDSWTAIDGSGRAVTRMIKASFPTPGDQRRWQKAGRPTLMANRTQTVRPTARWIPIGRGLTYQQLLDLPTSPVALAQHLLPVFRGSETARHAALFTAIGDLLRDDPVPGPLRAALYRLAAQVPGIKLVRSAHNSAGRRALAVAYTSTDNGPAVTSQLLFDPQTYALIGETGHSTGAWMNPSSTYLDQGIVSRLGQQITHGSGASQQPSR